MLIALEKYLPLNFIAPLKKIEYKASKPPSHDIKDNLVLGTREYTDLIS